MCNLIAQIDTHACAKLMSLSTNFVVWPLNLNELEFSQIFSQVPPFSELGSMHLENQAYNWPKFDSFDYANSFFFFFNKDDNV